MKNIINITPRDMVTPPKLGSEDTSYFVRKLSGDLSAESHREIIQSIYKHGFEDGYQRGCKHGKIIKLVNMR
jgi:hypothetical protein